jgi:glycosyltransferase involved in cell wall biosynthesis
VDAFVALSDFQKRLMVMSGLPEKKVRVKPNYCGGGVAPLPWHERQPYAVFAGRLTAEKGVKSLLLAWQKWGSTAPELRLAGDGALRGSLEQMGRGLPVRFLGQLSAMDAQAQIAAARLVVLPSEFETFSMAIGEAFASGTPVAASGIAPLASIVEDGTNGLLFAPRDPDSLLDKVRCAWTTAGLLERLGKGARATYERKYSEAANYEALIDIYRHAIDTSGGGASGWATSRPKTY